MSVAKRVVNRPTTVAIAFALLVGLGLFAGLNVQLDLFPEIEPAVLLVFTDYAGVGPEAIETAVTRPIEGVLGNVDNLESITSVSSEGSSQVTLEFVWGTNMDAAANDVRDNLELARNFLPDEAADPIIFKFNPSQIPILFMVATGNRTAAEIRRLTDDIIVPRLEQVEGVALASASGGRERTIRVDVPRNRLEAYGLTLGQVSQALAGQNLEISAGSILDGDRKLLVRTSGEYRSIEEIERVVVAYRGGGVNPSTGQIENAVPILLRDVADIRDGLKDQEDEVLVNGEPAVYITIQRQSGTNAVRTADNVLDRVPEIERNLPAGIKLRVVQDTTAIIRDSLSSVATTGISGGVLAVLILLVFLRNLRSVITIALSMGISVIVTLMLMFFFDLTLNVMTLAGLALGIGMVVDNSIVVIEHIFRYREKGLKLDVAAILGSQEMMTAITASTLTTICVFAPLALFRDQLGLIGELVSGLAFTVVISLLSSLLVAIFLVPVLSSRYLPLYPRIRGARQAVRQVRGRLLAAARTGAQQADAAPTTVGNGGAGDGDGGDDVGSTAGSVDHAGSTDGDAEQRGNGDGSRPAASSAGNGVSVASDTTVTLVTARRGFMSVLRDGYQHALRFLLRHRLLFILFMVAALGSTAFLMPGLGFELFPSSGEDSVQVNVRLPPGTPLQRTREVVQAFGDIAQQEVVGYEDLILRSGEAGFFGFLGSTRTNRGSVTVTLPPFAERVDDSATIQHKLRSHFDDFPGAEFSFGGGGPGNIGSGSPIDVAVRSDDLDKARNTAFALRELMTEQFPEITEPTVGLTEGLPQLEIVVDRARAYALGLNIGAIGQEVRANVDGVVASRFREGGAEFDILVRVDEADRDDIPDLERISVLNNTGQKIPLASVARLVSSTSPASINRENQRRVIHIVGGLAPGAQLNLVEPALRAAIREQIPADEEVVIDFTGDFAELIETGTQLIIIIIISVFLVFGVMAAQFESFLDPFIVFFSLPMSFVGVIGIHVLTGATLSLFTAVGVVMLVGIVVNNGIVLVDYTNLLRKRGMEIKQACVEAAASRLRPILMTTLTTVLALLPVAFISGEGSGFIQPLAKTVVGGLTVATLATLFLVPVIYSVFNQWAQRRSRRRGLWMRARLEVERKALAAHEQSAPAAQPVGTSS